MFIKKKQKKSSWKIALRFISRLQLGVTIGGNFNYCSCFATGRTDITIVEVLLQ